jgi:hypothetical protein
MFVYDDLPRGHNMFFKVDQDSFRLSYSLVSEDEAFTINYDIQNKFGL